MLGWKSTALVSMMRAILLSFFFTACAVDLDDATVEQDWYSVDAEALSEDDVQSILANEDLETTDIEVGDETTPPAKPGTEDVQSIDFCTPWSGWKLIGCSVVNKKLYIRTRFCLGLPQTEFGTGISCRYGSTCK